MKPIESAEKIYNQYRDLILSDLSTEELIHNCAQLAVHIAYNSGASKWDEEEIINDNGTISIKYVNIEHNLEFWQDVKNELLKL
jgi:hypothetical protein